ncbi:hypothetical protein A1O3_06776 [Capronia epimyces CBS 606.96]|uniref:Uncharacterized protein n=1 Tax=Capronia epimyces CBS 606.96 TaxID=1182542 RepID=W9YL16_9EURO|nr:uncharacterized protein A1O3_06776 [Capronia epimyces CBS 606.96]EXJ82959.1 hypothetical protein A1O3_06776 [Capronia epimyces CBS 606.96]
MQPFARLATRAPHLPRQIPVLRYSAQPARFAHSSYGNEQSGMQQGTHDKNPKSHLEHPGPEAPASKGTATSSSSTNSQSQSKKSDTSSQDATPAIHRPKSAAEKDNPEVRKHNEEMEQRSDRTPNQLSEEDNKVDKRYWKGDVGPKDGK